ncbi:putative methyltransferase [Methanofervidicoccus sp. A16]|uniref:bis-aminopropyl spermidine synthase family protein n=1 Tax=Methanofervidicoccus sp. A16 TaxID=2607662 RepID=UPI00118C7EC2|nr:bis-aminopropyl spermidine synthase family protein [Methanofervidicoccus sp. A16]AXI24728.1 putative methyltransferase [Methanofervidicoccus sp. A16]
MKIIGQMGGKLNKSTLDLSNRERFKTFLKRLAEKVKVAEGVDAIESILRCIYRNQPVSTKGISQYTKLPLPVVSKVRSILERSRILKRDERGAVYTEYGRNLVEDNLKFRMKRDLKCPTCRGRGIVLDDVFKEILRKHKEYAKLRPTVNTRIDQSHATPETAVYRAAIMADRGDLEGKRVLFIGDDDLTSIPSAMTGFPEEVVVMDIDERLLNLIDKISKREGLNIETVKQDFREELDKKYWGRFDTVFTDPPYTLDGLKLFLSRGVEGLGDKGVLYLAFSHKPIEEYLEVQRIVNSMNFAIYELIPGFNIYEGSEIIGNTTFLARLVGKNLKKFKNEEINLSKLYTGEVRPTLRYYRCLKCGKVYKVDGKNVVIEDLVCECGGKKFKMVKRKKVKNGSGDL